MTRPDTRRLHVTLAVLAAAVLAGGLLTWRAARTAAAGVAATATGGAVPALQLYVNPGTTTPQIPLWAAVRTGRLESVYAVQSQLWKTTDHLQGLLLAGVGDAWIGHIDGFARARQRGAPVVLLAVTGWRKFALVSTDPAVGGLDDFRQRRLPYAPFGSPVVDIVRAIMPETAAAITFDPHEPRQLALKVVQGKERSALLPEPLITTLLQQVPSLRVVVQLEDEHARRRGGPARLPIAGLAVHARLVQSDPGRVEALLQAVLAAGGEAAADPEHAVDVLPSEFAEFVSHEVVRQSLARDVILALAARDVAGEIDSYLRVVAPELFADGASLDPGFVWAGPAAR